MPAIPPPLPQWRRRLALAWLLLGLVLAPALGRMHQVLHGPGSGAPPAHVHGHDEAKAPHALDVLHALFAGHGSADCQVLDQQTLVGAVLAHAQAPVQTQPQPPLASAPAAAPGTRRPAPFHARAPPLSA